jgi:hypothetical protein
VVDDLSGGRCSSGGGGDRGREAIISAIASIMPVSMPSSERSITQ